MENLFTPEQLLALWNRIYEWTMANVFVIDNAAQLAVIALTFGLAALLTRRLVPWLEKYKTHVQTGRMVALGSLGDPKQLEGREEPQFFRKIDTYAALQLDDVELADWHDRRLP